MKRFVVRTLSCATVLVIAAASTLGTAALAKTEVVTRPVDAQNGNAHDETGGISTERTVELMVLGMVFGAATMAESPVGNWKTVDGKSGKVVSEVRLSELGDKLVGTITGLTEPNDKAGKPKTCTACKGDDKDKAIVGLVIVKNLRRDGDRYKGGSFLDPEDGTVYKAELWIEDGKLKVRGYLGPFHKTQTWVRGS